MSAVFLKPGLKWDHLPGATEHKYVSVEELSIEIMSLVRDCRELADFMGVPMIDLELPALFLLADFVDLLGVSPVRKEVILGKDLIKALEKQSVY